MNATAASLFSLALISATVLTAGLASWFMYHRARGSYAFTLLMLALGWWSCAYAQELSSPDFSTAMLWGKLQYLSIVAVPPLWLIFALRYSGHAPATHPWNRLALAVVPLITLSLAWTTEVHGLIWAGITQRFQNGFHLLVVEHGPWFWVHTVYSYNLVIAGTALLLSAAWRAAPTYRRQSIALAVGALLPLFGNVLYVAGLTPVSGLDLTPLLFTASGTLFAWASFRSHLTRIGPVARNQLIEEMADVVLVLDEHGQIADINPAGQRLLGVEQVFGRHLAAVAPVLAPRLLADAAHELNVGEGAAARTFDVQRKPLRTWRGGQRGLLIVLREITLRKRAEARLRAQKELFAALAALAHAAAAPPTLRESLRSTLKVAGDLTGATRGSIFLFAEDTTVVQSVLVHGVDSTVAEQRVINKVLDGGLAGWAVRNRRVALAADTADDPRWIALPEHPSAVGSALAVPITEGGHVLGVITLTHDRAGYFQHEHAELMGAAAVQIGMAVRNTQMYESQRQLAEQAEAASRAKSTFLATMSHELRTPLNVIIGYGEILADDLRAHGAEESVRHLRQISEAGRRLLDQVNDILELSRIEAGQSHVELGPVDLAALAFNIATLTRPLAAQNHNVLALDCPDDLGIVVSDLGKLRQILLHLLSNACKFTDHGQVILEVRRESGPTGEAVLFRVVDTGIGISDEQLPQLFSDFTQGDGSSTRRYGGVGLGLALSNQLCRLIGGEISVQSRAGHGSTFVLRIPAIPAEYSAVAREAGGVRG